MLAVVRADASFDIGTGHVMRCLTLAKELKSRCFEVLFICREHPGNLIDFIKSEGFEVALLPYFESKAFDKPLPHSEWLGACMSQDAQQCVQVISTWLENKRRERLDLLVVDHYALDVSWETEVRSLSRRVLVIDDLADRSHDCDVLLDQTFERQADDYLKMVPSSTKLLLGSEYCLLRPEFASWRKKSLERRIDTTISNILISLGGVDKDNLTGDIIERLAEVADCDQFNITVILGGSSPWLREVTEKAESSPLNIRILKSVSNMAELLTHCDLAIGSAGTSTWERCALGVPTLMFVIATNQEFIASQLSKGNIIIPVGADYCLKTIFALLSPDQLKLLCNNSSTVTDGKGVSRVSEQVTREVECN